MSLLKKSLSVFCSLFLVIEAPLSSGESSRMAPAAMISHNPPQNVWKNLENFSWRGRSRLGTPRELLINSFSAYNEKNRESQKVKERELILKEQEVFNDPWVKMYAEEEEEELNPKSNIRKLANLLDFIELLQIKDYFRSGSLPKIDNKNFETDDLVRLRSLCGTFCFLKIEKGGRSFYDSSFSGLLVPGQPYIEGENDGYHIHTCLHTLEEKDINTLHFVPYGLPLEADYAFAVKEVQGYKENENNLKILTTRDLSSDNYRPYRTRDYSLVTIHARSVKGFTLKQVMKKRKDLDSYFQGNSLPDTLFNESNDKIPASAFGLERILVIGVPGPIDLAQDQFGFSISTNITHRSYNETGLQRSYNDDPQNNAHPRDMAPLLPGEFTSDYPAYYGMSGGPVLRCRAENALHSQRKCQIIGVIWGSERIFDKNNTLIDFRSIISSLPEH